MLNKMKEFYNSNIALSLGFVLSLIIVSFYEYNQILLKCPLTVNFIFKLMAEIGLAYIGGFVFYIVQVYIPEKRKKDLINNCISKPINRIILHIEAPITHFKDEIIGKDKNIEDLVEEDYKKICNNINPCDNAPMKFIDMTPGSYADYIYTYIKSVEKSSKEILDYAFALDAELISIINDILYSTYHEVFETYYNIKLKCNNKSIGFLEKEMRMYYKKCHELKAYAKRNGFNLDNL